jgi:hypothetical protein
MAPFDDRDTEREAPQGRGEQRPRDLARDDARGYLRLRLRLENDTLSVVGAHFVPGPLAFDESLQGSLVYEVRADDRRLGIGSVPDAGEMRSFPPPEPEAGQIGHHIVPLRATEFNVRVPAGELRASAPERIRVDVFTMKARPEPMHLSPAPLQTQLGREARLVARLDGLVAQKMEPRVRDELKRAMQQF